MTQIISRPGHDFTPGVQAEPHVAAMFAKHVITMDRLRTMVPSVFATTARDDVSDRYRFVPTSHVVDILADHGFLPVRAEQSLVRREGGAAFAMHMLRFRHRDFLTMAKVGDELPELVLRNSHDRSCAYQFTVGVFRLVCSNGAVCAVGDFGSFAVKHVGGPDFDKQIIDTTFRVVEETPKVMETVNAWKGIELTSPQRHAFAAAALELKENKPIQPAQLLTPKRQEDRKGDLWTTSQVIQEHLMRGGDRGRGSTGRRVTTRPIKSVNEDVKTNKALWRLTEEMARLVGAN
jgi:hypothetical protein